jgi:hypothetical protein
MICATSDIDVMADYTAKIRSPENNATREREFVMEVRRQCCYHKASDFHCLNRVVGWSDIEPCHVNSMSHGFHRY